MSDEKAALAIVTHDDFIQPARDPYAVHSLDEAIRLAEFLATSITLPKHLQNRPADIVAVMMKGHELGLSPMQAFAHLALVNGKVTMEAQLILALCVRAKKICKFFELVETTPVRAAFRTQRVGHGAPTELAFTIQDAAKMGLSTKDNWVKQPAVMLRWRAISALAKLVYPDLVAGIYDPDELDPVDGAKDVTPAPPTTEPLPPTPAPATRTEKLRGLVKAKAAPVVVTVPAVVQPAATPAPAGEGPVACVPMGKLKGTPVTDLKPGQLDWYANVARENIANPDKARFKDEQIAWLGALEAEQARRIAPAPTPEADGWDEPPVFDQETGEVGE